MKGGEAHLGGNPKGDNCKKLISKRLRGGSMAEGGLQNVTDERVGRLLVVSKIDSWLY